MLNEGEKTDIINLTKSPTWGLVKQLFQEKKDSMLEYMGTLDVDDADQRKEYKKRRASLKAFDSLIEELENLDKDRENEEAIKLHNEGVESFLSGEEESVDKKV